MCEEDRKHHYHFLKKYLKKSSFLQHCCENEVKKEILKLLLLTSVPKERVDQR